MVVTSEDLKRLLWRQCVAVGGPAAWCRLHGFSRSVPTQIRVGTMEITDRVAEALGYRRPEGWERIPERPMIKPRYHPKNKLIKRPLIPYAGYEPTASSVPSQRNASGPSGK